MGKPYLQPFEIPTLFKEGINGLPQGSVDLDKNSYQVAAVGMGNPHLVIPVESFENIKIKEWGSYLEHHEQFPSGTNVHFVNVISQSELQIKIWERGSGETLACGTGACASLVACSLLGLCEREANVELPGGNLFIQWDSQSNCVYMTGSAIETFRGFLYQI